MSTPARAKKTAMGQTFLIGLMALLPLALTLGVIIWLAGFLDQFLGPESLVGRALVALGLPFAGSTVLAYLLGALIALGFIYCLGLILQRGLEAPLQRMVGGLVRRIPVVGNIYDLAERIVDMFNQKQDPALRGMTPVWCFFGGAGGAAVLALRCTPEPVEIGGQLYCGILVPSAPVPVGGGLLFVPVDWVKPAEFGADGLTSIYVSMGVTAPSVLEQARKRSQPRTVTDIS